MKKQIFFTIILLLGFIALNSCYEPIEPVMPDNSDTIKPPDGAAPEMLTKYSWKMSKYYYRQEDSSLVDMSEYYFHQLYCDTLSYTFDVEHKVFWDVDCKKQAPVFYWLFSDDYKYIGLFHDEDFSDLEYYYKVELLTKDSLKLLVIYEVDSITPQVKGELIYLHSIPIISH